MVQLPPSEFTFGRYGSIILPWDVIKSTADYVEWLLAQNITGYCNSGDCEIRPRPDDMAVMFEDEDGFQSWVHIPIDIWKEHLKLSKL